MRKIIVALFLLIASPVYPSDLLRKCESIRSEMPAFRVEKILPVLSPFYVFEKGFSFSSLMGLWQFWLWCSGTGCFSERKAEKFSCRISPFLFNSKKTGGVS